MFCTAGLAAEHDMLGEYGIDLDDGAAVRRWTTGALYPDEIGWLREALALNAEEPFDDEEDEDLELLR